MWIWFISIAVIVSAWFGGQVLNLPNWAKILITVLAVLLLIGWFAGKRIVALLKARALEREIMKQAEQQAMGTRPDRRAEIQELTGQVQRGIEALKSSKVGIAKGRAALYALPWYVIIGPPGAGKTTALKHSGLGFPFLDGGVRGVGGTRNCDWWFSNEAILLDTAGRYATESDDREEWLAFLGLTKKHRPAKPVNGVIVAISVTDLADASEDQVDEYAKKLRARVDEIMTQLHMVVPVYVVFTKLDLVAGFTEFWGDLRKSERAQLWGATFPLEGADTRDNRRSFSEEFGALVNSIHARAVSRVGSERQLEQRVRIFQFPMEFRALENNLAEFVDALFARNTYQETPIMRGVYFTSGTQEGTPLDRVMSGMMRAFNIAPAHAEPQLESKSYFLTDVFRKVIFPDQFIAARTKGELRRQLISRLIFAGVATLFAALWLVPAFISFGNNRATIKRATMAANSADGIRWDGRLGVLENARQLDELRKELVQLDEWNDKGPPLAHRWGLYTGNNIAVPLREVFVANMEAGFVATTKRQLEGELSALVEGQMTVDQYNENFGRLKAYLLMCGADFNRLDRISDEKERLLQTDIQSAMLTEAWSRGLGVTARVEQLSLLPHVGYYGHLLRRGHARPWNCDARIVARTRLILKSVREIDRDYNALIRDPNSNVEARITRDKLFKGMAFYDFITSKSSPEAFVAGAYTKWGWDNFVRERLLPERAKELAQEGWVLGDNEQRSTAQTEQRMRELRDTYFKEFQKAWSAFLRDLDVRTPKSNAEALDELQALSESPWPYLQVLKTVQENTVLTDASDTLANKAESRLVAFAKEEAKRNVELSRVLGADAGVFQAAKAKDRYKSPVEEAFEPMVRFGVPDPDRIAPTSLAHYQEQVISKLVGILSDMKDAKGQLTNAKDVQLAFQEAFRTSKELLNSSQSGFTRPLLTPLLMNPIQLGYAGVLNDIGGAAGGKWEAEVWKRWRSQLEDRYPFTDSTKEATIADFTEFFQPQTGLLFGFADQHLKGALERQGTRFVPTTRFGKAISFTSPFLSCYERGLEIATATFPSKSEAPSVDFEVNIHSVSENVGEVTFDLDGTARSYKNEPEQWLHATWPAKDAKKAGARLVVRGFSGLDEEISRPGQFGFFRLLDAATRVDVVTEPGGRTVPRTFTFTWTLRSQPGSIKIDVRAPKDDNVFTSYVTRKARVFRDYQCPRVIAKPSR